MNKQKKQRIKKNDLLRKRNDSFLTGGGTEKVVVFKKFLEEKF